MLPLDDCTRSLGESSSLSWYLSDNTVGCLVVMSNSLTERVLCVAPSKLPFVETAKPLVPTSLMNTSHAPPGVYLMMSPVTLPPAAPCTKLEKKKAPWLATQ